MPLVLPYKGKSPKIHPTAKIAPNATITGDVEIGANVSIWFNVVIRGDVNKIVIEDSCNIQDGVIIHSTRGKIDTHLGPETSVGHGAILHGCITKGRSLIGMGAIILDDAIIDQHVIIGANSLVSMSTHCEHGFIYTGTPAKMLKSIDKEKISFYIDETTKAYIKYADGYPSFNRWKVGV